MMAVLLLCTSIAVRASGTEKVTVANERRIDYPKYWGIYDTHYYSVQTENGKKTAYCMEPDKNQVLSGEYTASALEGRENLRAALYYGYGGPGQSEYIDKAEYKYLGNCTVEDAKYVLTHLAVSYFYNPEQAFKNMDAGDIANSGIWKFIDWLEGREVPAVTSSFSKTEVLAHYEQGADTQRTESIKYMSDSAENQIVIECPKEVILHNETTGRAESGKVTVKANESFYFTAPLNIVSLNGAVWKSGAITGEKDQYWEAMAVPSVDDRQVSGYGNYSRQKAAPIQFQVKWVSLGGLKIQKTDKNTKQSAGAGFQFAVSAGEDITSEDGTVRIKKGERIQTLVTDDSGTAGAKGLYPGKYIVKEETAGEYYAKEEKEYEVVLSADDSDKNSMVPVNIENEKTRIKIKKTDEDNKETYLKSAEFCLYREDEIEKEQIEHLGELLPKGGKKLVTDEKGICIVSDLKHGTKYYIVETKAPAGYVRDTGIHELYVDKDGHIESKTEFVLELSNKPVTVEISKRGEDGKEELEGAGLLLCKEDGTKVCEWTSGKEPYEIKALEPGIYILTETKAPHGYEKAENIMVEVKEISGVQQFEMVDAFLKGQIAIVKKDGKGKQNLGEGFRFLITAGEDIVLPYGKILYTKGDAVEEICTDEKGTAVSGALFPGIYEISEIQSGEYYAVDERKFNIELQITEENQVENREIQIENEKTQLQIEKTDFTSEMPIEGVIFAICEGGEEPEIEEIKKTGIKLTTDEEGLAVFEELQHERTYYLAEIESKDGYAPDDTIYSFQVDEKGLINGEKTYLLKISNKQLEIETDEEEEEEKDEHVKIKETKPKTVKTKDESMWICWTALLMFSAGCLVFQRKRRKR